MSLFDDMTSDDQWRRPHDGGRSDRLFAFINVDPQGNEGLLSIAGSAPGAGIIRWPLICTTEQSLPTYREAALALRGQLPEGSRVVLREYRHEKDVEL